MLRNHLLYTGMFTGLLLITACSVQKKIPPGTYLYKGAHYRILKEKTNKTADKYVRNQLKGITSPAPNKTILGFPYRVALWYAIKEPKKQKGFTYWLRNKIGEAPVLNTALSIRANAANFQDYLDNKGFFKTLVAGDTAIKGYRVSARYTITLGMPYTINSYRWITDSASPIGKDIGGMPAKASYLKKGERYDYDNIKAERSRTELYLKTTGYYYFSAEDIKAWVDSSKGHHTVNIFFRLKEDIPKAAIIPQTIRTITLFPNYNLQASPPDTSATGLEVVNGLYIHDTLHTIHPSVLIHNITYQSGSLYNMEEQNKTLNRFINMGVFKFVKNRFRGNQDTATLHFLDVNYYLTPLPKKSLQAELGTFTKSNSFNGAQASITWRDRNIFKGAEQLSVKTYGSIETSNNDSIRANNNFSLGEEVSLLFPRFITPFKIHENSSFPPQTKFTVSYEWFRREALYTKNYFHLQYDLGWKQNAHTEHTLSPVSITYNTTADFSNQYLALVSLVPTLQFSNLPEVIIGSFYHVTYHSTNPKAANIFYFNGTLEGAGNTVGLFDKATSPYSKQLFSAYFSQYVKTEAELRYSRKLDENIYWANRMIIGAGFPYGNSSFLPFSRQFIIGGASSIRGFQPRQLGPGRVQTNAFQQLYLPQIGGDYKLEMNTELRFPLISKLKGALFLDAGNIWTKDTVLYGKSAQFNSHFINDIAVSAGFGFRLDISILIIRLDIAAPLREPYLPRGQEWVIGNFQPLSSTWRNNNIVYNIAIGYPF